MLGRSLDELPPQTRRVLSQLQPFVAQQAQVQAIATCAVRFTRRELRAALGLSDKQLRVHVERLVELEYVIAHAGRNGQRFVYELAFDGDATSDAPQAAGLVALDDTTTTANLVGGNADLVARSWSARGDRVAASCGEETTETPQAKTVFPALVAASDETARQDAAPLPRRNGASYPARSVRA